ncbi:MAG: aminotransferase class I/II-fold pyridoxal phosphate-dependent enzyme [Chitinispirillaceae bacterium]|nr:aminotransferase class I/II-fold pyridoxal phosphate-dependent enzyme [Chitinispirillaceae bacterium]
MKAIILAAGYGNRMRPLTDSMHKTMLEVAGETIIGRIIGGLLENGIFDIVVVTGYRAGEVSSYCRNKFTKAKFTFVHNEKYRETNNIYSMALAFEAVPIDTDIILIESDLIYRPEIIRRLIESPYGNVALVDRYRHGMDGTVVSVQEKRITNVIPSHLQPENFDFSDKYKTLNIYKFSKELCETSFKKLLVYYANAIDDNCYYELILGILIYMQRETVFAEIVEGESWAEVDDPNDLQVADFAFHRNRKEILEYSFGGYWNYEVLDFCFIRNMYFPNHAMISELRNSLPDLIHNYGSRQAVLDRKMSWFLLCKESNVLALNGASQIYPMLAGRFGAAGVFMPQPSFGEYRRIFKNSTTYDDKVGFDLKGIERGAHGAEIVVFVNPNNPTGSLIPPEWIFSFAEKNRHQTVIVDESFIEFAGVPPVLSLLEKKPLDNVLVIKSLSKSLGVPGIRLGYAYSWNAELMKYLRSQVPIWNMNSIAEHYLEIILKHRNALTRSFVQTAKDRAAFSGRLAACPQVERVYQSAGNFLCVELKEAAAAVRITARLLEEHSIFIKDVTDKFNIGRDYLRLAVRLPEENERLIKALKEIGRG